MLASACRFYNQQINVVLASMATSRGDGSKVIVPYKCNSGECHNPVLLGYISDQNHTSTRRISSFETPSIWWQWDIAAVNSYNNCALHASVRMMQILTQALTTQMLLLITVTVMCIVYARESPETVSCQTERHTPHTQNHLLTLSLVDKTTRMTLV